MFCPPPGTARLSADVGTEPASCACDTELKVTIGTAIGRAGVVCGHDGIPSKRLRDGWTRTGERAGWYLAAWVRRRYHGMVAGWWPVAMAAMAAIAWSISAGVLCFGGVGFVNLHRGCARSSAERRLVVDRLASRHPHSSG
jgi:hypothetical protein